MNESRISGLVLTGLLAVMGTVAGGVVKGYWDTSLAHLDFQSKLILHALEPDDVGDRVQSLQFLVDAKLITNPEVRAGLISILDKGEEAVPQFRSVHSAATIGSPGVTEVGSARDRVVEKFPTLQGKNIALVGFRVRHGDIVDAVTPIYAEVTESLELRGEFDGDRIGGIGGRETVLTQPGHVVTGFDIHRGNYFGRSEVVHIVVVWNRLTENGIDANSTVTSDKLGSGNYAQIAEPPKRFRANENAFISDFAATVSQHTSGETFLNDIAIKETVIVDSK